MYRYNMRSAIGMLLNCATTGTVGVPHLSMASMSLAYETSRALLFETDKFVGFRTLLLIPNIVCVKLGFRSLSGVALKRLRTSDEDGFISTKRLQAHSNLLIRQPVCSIREEDRIRCRARGVANGSLSVVTMGVSRTQTGGSRSFGICKGSGFKTGSISGEGTRAIYTSTPVEVPSTDSVDVYDAEKIQVLEGLEPVRKRPGMSIGRPGCRGVHSGGLQAGFATQIDVELQPDGSNSVTDNGRGISTGVHRNAGKSAVETVLTELRAGGEQEKGEEVGQFRRRGTPGRGSAVEDSRGKRTQFQEMGAVRGQTSPDSSGRTTLNPKENSPEETVRKYPPRRLEGEKRWQYAVRKKQLGLAGHTRGSTRKIAPQFTDDEELGNEPKGGDWRWKKRFWLCKEIPTLRPRPVVSILNDQRKWINAEDTEYVIEHLLQLDHTLRAHRVLKWEMQQPWYEFNYELCSKVAVQLGQNNKLSRTRDMYDMIIKNGKVPDVSTYEVLINCYIVDGENTALTQAWSLYNQMSQLGGHEPPPTLSYNLFQGLAQKGLVFLNESDELFKRIKMSGLVCSTEMYSLLIHIHGTKGNKDRVEDLIKEMKETGLPVGLDVYAAILKSCAKDGNVVVGEQAFTDLKMTGYKPIPSIYSSLIKMYGKAGLPVEAFRTFEEMRETGTSPNLLVYEPMIEVAVLSDNKDQAEKLLKEAQERGTPSLHASYNSVMELYSKNGLLEDLDRLFNDMETEGYPPNQASYNVLLEAYVKHRLLEKAEAVYETMRQSGKVKPNRRTYNLMIKLYGDAKRPEKLKEVFKQLTDRKLDIPEESKRYLEAVVNPERLEVLRLSKLKLKREQREILAGVLLAGAGVQSHDSNRTYEVHFRLDPETAVGLPLVNHLYQQFSDWSTGPPKKEPLSNPKEPKRSKVLLAFQTVSHGSFRFFAHQYRPNHSPVIPRLVHRWLTPRALAYWYMYGGIKCSHTGDILLNVSAYDDQGIMLVVNALKSRTIDCEKKRTSSGLAICFNGRSAIWLWGLMEPYILPEVKDLLKPDDDQGGEDLMQQP